MIDFPLKELVGKLFPLVHVIDLVHSQLLFLQINAILLHFMGMLNYIFQCYLFEIFNFHGLVDDLLGDFSF